MEKMNEFDDSVWYRFQCDCGYPEYAIDVEKCTDSPESFYFYFYDIPNRFRDRVRWAWRMLTKGEGFNHDWCLRNEDVENLRAVLKRTPVNHT